MQTRNGRKISTKTITVLAMLSALAFVVMAVGRIPIVMFLKYDPKDVIITIGGFLYGPLASFAVSAVVSFIEMFTVSTTGYIGLIMNIISSCSFACTASFIYKRKHTLKGAVAGLVAGWLFATAVMLLWNYLISPLYMNQSREAIAKMLIPTFLPFNLLKGGINAAITMLLYKPVVMALRKTGMISGKDSGKGKISIGVLLASAFVLATCILVVLVWQGKI